MGEIKEVWDMLWDIYSKAEGTPWENAIPIIVVGAVLFLLVKLIIIPLGKGVYKLYGYISNKWFVKKQIYEKLSFMDSSDLYYAIKNYVPTRFSRIDPSNNEEPIPEYIALEGEKEPLLLEHFLKYEYSIKNGGKYYLCLGDCGMGKTTFLINLYYQTLKLHKYKCVFISLQEENCIEQIQAVEFQSKTILLLDALDENENALTDYAAFSTMLERATHNFYRVIITARTNFFENETKEQISNNKSNASMLDKLSSSRKYYISPFTDEDIKKFLRKRYHHNSKKIKKAWTIVEKNKNLSVRPLLLRFMDELLKEDYSFEYDFQLYEYLFGKWIEREKRNINEDLGKNLYEECLLMAKRIYYQWQKNGKIGVYLEDIKGDVTFGGIESIQLKGHALINRTSDGMYKFSHKSYWEFLLAKLAVSDFLFSDELLIKNFDRATAFLEEMIQYSKSNSKQHDVFFSIGVANYLLKYKKPEDAEEQLKYVINKCSENEQLHLYAHIKLAECYWRQIKYESAKKVLNLIYDTTISNSEIDIENAVLYSKFAITFSTYCREYRLVEGQKFLEKIIIFFENNKMLNYNLLRCYSAYSYCCVNYKAKQDFVEKMSNTIGEYFKYDQYAKYLYLCAISWKTQYKIKGLLDIIDEQIRQYVRFMDAYELIINNCDMAVSMYSYYNEQDSFFEHQDAAIDYFGNAYDICNLIYKDNNHIILNNPYMVTIQKKLVLAFSVIKVRKLNELVEPILNYSRNYKHIDEMRLFCSDLLKKEGNDKLEDFRSREKYLLQALELVKNNFYKMADIYWDLYVLYDDNDQIELGQQYLEKAYRLAIDKIEIYMTPLYCGILRVTLEFYRGQVNRDDIIQTLLEITPKVYGSDNRKKSVYQALRRVLLTMEDQRLINVCIELLQLEFSCEVMENLFDICNKYDGQEKFIVYINFIIAKREFLSLEECNVLEKFLKEKKENFSCDVVNYFYEIINKAKKGRNNFIFSNKEINYDNSSNQLLKLGYKSCDSKFFENINVSESSVHKDIDLDLQKELEKKFDELFGSLDEDETNIKEENSQQENLSKDDNVIVLNDEDGNDIKFDFLDLIEYDGDEFVVLLPSDENADEVVILKVEDGETEDTESYVSVDDDLVLNNVFSIFKERFKEEFHFCESNE